MRKCYTDTGSSNNWRIKYINEAFSEYTVEKRRVLFKRGKEIREEASLTKLFTTGLFRTKFDMQLLSKM